MKKLFTGRQWALGRPRTEEALDDTARLGLFEAVSRKIQQGWFGKLFFHMWGTVALRTRGEGHADGAGAGGGLVGRLGGGVTGITMSSPRVAGAMWR